MAEYLKLKKSNCKNCYKCIRCCPVKSIRFSGGQANIVGNECILCGQCFVNCPQNAKEIDSSVEATKVHIYSGAPVIASIAPAFIANYNGVGIKTLEVALKKLGFHHVEETAIGATIVKNEYEKMIIEDKKNILITSSCHSVNLLIQKYYPNALPYLADVVSPMQAHALDIKKRYPDAKVVFIGPCVAKKDEAGYYSGIVDVALTFEELSQWLEQEDIKLDTNVQKDNTEESLARFFPTTGGILKTITNKASDYSYFAVDGVENCMKVLDEILEGKVNKCFIEMSACVGSCIGGPVMEKSRKNSISDNLNISGYAGKKDFVVSPLSAENMQKNFVPIEQASAAPSKGDIANILRQIGKENEADELNCGSCGYNSCREKAEAVYYGKADLTMCLPFLNEKAESFSELIVNNTPNAIIVLNDSLEVQKANQSAVKLLNLRSQNDILGEQIIKVLDPTDFITVRNTSVSIKDKKVYLTEYNKHIHRTIIFDKQYKMLVCIMRDITEDEEEKAKKEEISRKTIDTTDKVIEKQMKVVHEIASLLGETAAETKIALTKLKESIKDD